ncbi:hypothetical protein Tco_0222379 [Tanacetum coccineum]
MMVQDQEEVGEDSEMPTGSHHTPTIIQPSTSQPQKKQRSRRSKRKDTEVPQPSGPITNVADEAVNEEMDDSLERAATTATGLEAEQDNGNIDKTQYKATLNEPSSSRTSSCSGPRHQETMVNTIAQTRSKNVSKLSNDSLLARGNTLRSGEDRLELEELMALYMFGVHDLVGDEVVVETEVASKYVNLSVDEVTLAQALAALKSSKPKADKVMLQEPEQGTITTTTTATTVTAASIRPKAKGLVIHEEEQATTLKVSSQQPSRLQAGFDKEINYKDADYQMAQQMQAEEQEKLSIKEKSKLFVQLLEARKKHFSAMRAQEERNKPPTKAQKRNTMSTYLKKHDMDIELVEGSEVRAEGSETRVEGSSKRAGQELEQESSKKQKLEEDKETTELQRLIEVVPDKEEVAIDDIPLETKLSLPSISSVICTKGFNKERKLETLWKLVKSKHGSTRPEEGYEKVLWEIGKI